MIDEEHTSTRPVFTISADDEIIRGEAAWATENALREDAENLLSDLISGQGHSWLYNTTSPYRIHTSSPSTVLHLILDHMGWRLNYWIDSEKTTSYEKPNTP